MPDVDIMEFENRVIEITTTPGAEVPGHVWRSVSIKVLSGPGLTDEQFVRLKQIVTRSMIDAGCQVRDWKGEREGSQ